MFTSHFYGQQLDDRQTQQHKRDRTKYGRLKSLPYLGYSNLAALDNTRWPNEQIAAAVHAPRDKGTDQCCNNNIAQ